MIVGPRYKLCRRLGSNIFEKCQTQKFVLSESKKGAVVKKGKRPGSGSDYGVQLLNKQKVRYTYGLSERQFSKYVKEASLSREVSPTQGLYEALERRLDNVVYRLLLAPSRAASRQMVTHGHILVNGRRLNVPSYQVRQSDVIAIREGSKNKPLFAELEKTLKGYNAPSWLKFNSDKREAVIAGKPAVDGNTPMFDLDSVIEFYSR